MRSLPVASRCRSMSKQRDAKPFRTIDCETDPFKEGRVPRPFIWGCYDGQTGDYWEFDDAAGLIAHLREYKGIVYAHNGGRFDFHYLRDFINSDQVMMVISGRLAKFKIGECEFRDSMNILVNPLRAFAKDEIDYAKLEEDVREQNMPEIKKYLRSDCVNLWETIAKYFASYGRSLTQAGSAMKYWKRVYEFPFTPQTAIQAERCREFYYGGRVECFKTGHGVGDFKVVDINSAYPRGMKEKHPISPNSIPMEHLPAAGDFGRCFMKLLAVADGCFPFREEDGKLSFPNDGKPREYSVTGWELEAALELNLCRIIRVIDVRRFTQTVDFVDYVDHFYAERKRAKAAGDKAADVFAKLFLNSLYGKFAADPEKYHEYVISHPEDCVKWLLKDYIDTGPWGERRLLVRKLPEQRHHYYNVATAASITGWVRSYLMRGIAACEGVLYCDTDSIAARDISRLPLGPELGQWKLELTGTEYAIAAKKTYAFKSVDGTWKTASKGVKLTPEEIVRCAKGETIRHAPIVPTYSIFRPTPEFVTRAIRRTESGLHVMQ